MVTHMPPAVLHSKRCPGCGRVFETPSRHRLTCGERECQRWDRNNRSRLYQQRKRITERR